MDHRASDRPHVVPALPQWGVHVESHRHGPDFRTSRHAHPHHSLIYVVSGEGYCRLNQDECPLFPGAAILLDRGVEHQLIDRPKQPMVVFVLYFDASEAERNKDLVRELLDSARPIATPQPYVRPIRGALRQMLHEQSTRPLHYRTAIRQGLTTVLLQLRRAQADTGHQDSRQMEGAARVSAVLEYVAGHYYDHHGLADAARMAHLSQRQFSSLCRRATGTSYVQYVNRVRTQRARALLEESRMSVSAVAFEVGYEELSTFYRAFRRTYGKRPLEVRREETGPGRVPR